jgi:hypothetical protein
MVLICLRVFVTLTTGRQPSLSKFLDAFSNILHYTAVVVTLWF